MHNNSILVHTKVLWVELVERKGPFGGPKGLAGRFRLFGSPFASLWHKGPTTVIAHLETNDKEMPIVVGITMSTGVL